MNAVTAPVRNWFVDLARGWDAFWLTGQLPHSLAVIRILGGAMLFYTHLVWALNSSDFLGPNAWITRGVSKAMHAESYAFSLLWYFDSPVLLAVFHAVALVAMLMLTVGLFTRPAAVVSWLACVWYCHRLEGALFGLDQVNAMLAFSLMIGRSGAAYSLDRWRHVRQMARQGRPPRPFCLCVGTNLALRLIQTQLCVIYLFGGLAKAKGEMWWNGDAIWFAAASLEYQSWDMTWIVDYHWLGMLAVLTVFWEIFYPVLVWNRYARPIMLGMAVLVHGGIALCLGMITFGLAMIFANVAFVKPEVVKGLVERCCRNRSQSQPRSGGNL